MDTYYPNSTNQEIQVSTTSYVPTQKLNSYDELSCFPNNMLYLNQTSAGKSYLELHSANSQSPTSCDEVHNVPLGDHLSPSSTQQLNMSEGVLHERLTKPQILSRTSVDCEDVHDRGLFLSLGAELTSSRNLPSVQHQFGNPDPLQLINFLTQDSGKLASQNVESNTDQYLSFGLAGNREDINRFEDFNNPDNSRQMQYAQNLCVGSQFEFSNSNYLMGAQELLDEVVNVYEALKKPNCKYVGQVDGSGLQSVNGIVSGHCESTTNSSVALSDTERLDQDSKLMKLQSLLKEVDTRYKQYHHQLMIVQSSFEIIAGGGSAKRYTSVALQTISCQFRSLRDAINRQIQVCRESLREQDDAPNSSLLPRLSYVDKHIRQQRTLQQLGIIRHSWRPQKGLPESSVSVLRAWLFEHFLNPYPTDSEKSMLARKACLTRSQVANWFINARVRLWKPMVEDMYKEEFGDLEAEKKESIMSGSTYDSHLNQSNDSNVHHPKGDGSIDREVINLHGDNWSSADEHYNCPQMFITSNQTSDANLNVIAPPYDLSAFGDFTIGNQVANFTLQC